MIRNFKICIPTYKIVFASLFFVFLALARGITQVNEIGIAMDAYVGLLAAIFCSDTYEIEYREKRWEIFRLLPSKNRRRTIRQRLYLQFAFLGALAAAGYWLFYWQSPQNFNEESPILLYGMYVIAVLSSIIFWGALSMSLVNFFRNLWVGIGGSVIIWVWMNSTWGNELLGNFSVFSFGFRPDGGTGKWGWLMGKGVAMVIAIFLIGRKGRKYEY